MKRLTLEKLIVTSFADRSHNLEATSGSVWCLQVWFKILLSNLSVVLSLAEKEVPVSAVSKIAASLLFQPRLESKEDGGLGALPHVLACQVVYCQDHVLQGSGEVPEHFGPDGDFSTATGTSHQVKFYLTPPGWFE